MQEQPSSLFKETISSQPTKKSKQQKSTNNSTSRVFDNGSNGHSLAVTLDENHFGSIHLDTDVMHRALTSEDYYGENDLAIDVLRNKYLAPNEKGPMQMWQRIAKALASVEHDKEFWYNKFLELLFDFKFIPGGRVMHGAGREEAKRRPTLSNCYVIPIEDDSLEGIYRGLAEAAMVYRTGGGVGTDLSILRPEGASVNATIDKSPGATAFMNLFSESTNTVSQAGRRGALMLTIRVDHPDVEKFITIKNDPLRLKVAHANVSVLITHEFMNAVINDTSFDLQFKGKIYKTVKAKELWMKIIRNAHSSAEPGILFWDTMKEYHNVEYAAPLSSTNPCGEQPLAAYTACNLGNINLTKFVNDEGEFDFEHLAEVTHTATRFMDNVIEYNIDNHAFEKIKKAVTNDRRIGLGITGLGDALAKMHIRYDTQDALDATEKIMRVIRDESYKTSIELAKERGAFPLYNWDGYSQSKFVQSLPHEIQTEICAHGIRNGTVLTLPPVGTGSIVGQTSSGIEPIFCTSYVRRVKNHDGQTFNEYKVYHPLVKQMFGSDEKLPEYIVTAHDIDPYFRVKMQGVIQKYIDSSISSTVNLAEETSVETIADIYIQAYKAGLKGITVYREGSRQGILITDEYAKKLAEQTKAEGVTLSEPTNRKPRRRPKQTFGVTERINTGEGYLYVTINSDENGLCEVFTTIGKAGGNAAAQSEAISRLISLALRSGIDPLEITKQLKGISGPTPVWENGDKVLSTPDAIGKAMERYLSTHGNKFVVHKPTGETKTTSSQAQNNYQNPKGMPSAENGACPDCGSNIVHTGSCVMCNNCGWSKC
ncbi:MAG: adenosylcobalamin-dependent ribonucleoside-diphosphate reductase [Ignavibacteriales bacterium]|nr:adenosylcobalamin-dependent ribonucleoside-diphosphate reductase [Ignavibacteriales bacterium]